MRKNDHHENLITGMVVRSTGKWARVQAQGKLIYSRVRGRIRLEETRDTNPIAVGDRVSLRINEDGTGLITKVHDRTNALIRRAAGRRVGFRQVIMSNVERVWIVQSAAFPEPNSGLIDRILVSAESQEIKCGILINKIDLAFGNQVETIKLLRRRYSWLGYPVILTSTVVGEGIESVKEALLGNLSILSGPSGVGKTSILNAIEPGLNLRTGDVSDKTRKGRHTTAHAELFLLSGGGGVVDTPGIREFGVLDIEPWELGHYFPEFRRHLAHCQFAACTHDHEPGCKVKVATAEKSITEQRYQSYLSILGSILAGANDVGR